MYWEPSEEEPDAVRIRFALNPLEAQRLFAEHALAGAAPTRHPLRIWRLAGRPRASTHATAWLWAGARARRDELRLQVRAPLRSAARPPEAGRTGGLRLVVECDATRRVRVLELIHWPVGPGWAPPLSPAQHDLLSGACSVPPQWSPAVDLVEEVWSSSVSDLPVTLQRWTTPGRSPEAGRIVATELRAAAPPADAPVLLVVLTAHLRLTGVDPVAGRPWLEERLPG